MPDSFTDLIISAVSKRVSLLEQEMDMCEQEYIIKFHCE